MKETEFELFYCVNPDCLDDFHGGEEDISALAFVAFIRRESITAVVRYKNLTDEPTPESAAVYQIQLSNGRCLYALESEGMDMLMSNIGTTSQSEYDFWCGDTLPRVAT